MNHYRTATYPNQLLIMAKQDAALAACMGASEEVVRGFIETAEMVAEEKGWKLFKEET
jgi:hypothetical protein